MFLYKVIRSFEKHQVDYAIVGGFAVGLHGAVRGTLDLDLVIRLKQSQYEAAEAALKSIGLEPRLPLRAEDVFTFRREYIENRNLVAWTFVNPKTPSEVVDIIITHDLSKLKAVTIKSGNYKLRVINVTDLIRMKMQSGRPQDLEDVLALERLKK